MLEKLRTAFDSPHPSSPAFLFWKEMASIICREGYSLHSGQVLPVGFDSTSIRLNVPSPSLASESDVHLSSLPPSHLLLISQPLSHLSSLSSQYSNLRLQALAIKKMPLYSFILTLMLVPLIFGAPSLKKTVELSKVAEKKPEQFPTLRTLLRSMAKDVSAKEVIRKLFKSKLRMRAILKMKNKQTKLSFDKQDVQKLFKPAGKSETVKKHSSQTHTYLLFLRRVQ